MKRRPCLTCGRLTNGSRCPEHQGRNGSTRAWRALRAAVLDRDGHRCQKCGASATHVDHVMPLAHGGTDNYANLRALCARCNLSKGSK